jgi:hypothetical protein
VGIWYILLPFGTFYGHLVYFSRFTKKKSGNPAEERVCRVTKFSNKFYNIFPARFLVNPIRLLSMKLGNLITIEGYVRRYDWIASFHQFILIDFMSCQILFGPREGCQIFLGTTYQKRGKYTK